jgi:hypothetical protein
VVSAAFAQGKAVAPLAGIGGKFRRRRRSVVDQLVVDAEPFEGGPPVLQAAGAHQLAAEKGLDRRARPPP